MILQTLFINMRHSTCWQFSTIFLPLIYFAVWASHIFRVECVYIICPRYPCVWPNDVLSADEIELRQPEWSHVLNNNQQAVSVRWRHLSKLYWRVRNWFGAIEVPWYFINILWNTRFAICFPEKEKKKIKTVLPSVLNSYITESPRLQDEFDDLTEFWGYPDSGLLLIDSWTRSRCSTSGATMQG